MNFVICDKASLFRSYYIYLDYKDNFSDKFLSNNKVKTRCIRELEYPDSEYTIKYVSINNQKDYLFVKAMCELEETIIENGDEEYLEVCDKVFSKIMKSKKKVRTCMI